MSQIRLIPLFFEIRKTLPDGKQTSKIWGPFGATGGRKFNVTSKVPIVGFFGEISGSWSGIGFWFAKEQQRIKNDVKMIDSWDIAVKTGCVNWYFLSFLGRPGFFMPTKLYRNESPSILNFLIGGMAELMDDDDRKHHCSEYLLEHYKFRLSSSETVPDLLLCYDIPTETVSFQTDWVPPFFPEDLGHFNIDHGVRIPLFKPDSERNKIFVECLQFVVSLIERKIGWSVKNTKIIYANEQPHRAYYFTTNDKVVYVVESDRSPFVNITKESIKENVEVIKKFEEKYNDTWEKVNKEWHDKIDEYTVLLEKNLLSHDQRREWIKFFQSCKDAVQQTLSLADIKYTIFNERYFQLVNFEDYTDKPYHDISPKELELNDDEMTDLLISRARNDEAQFKALLNYLEEQINITPNIRELCHQLKIERRFYPINMQRNWDKNDYLNQKKVKLLVGPLKTKARGLQKVIETPDKKLALLDALRASILCKDPSVPIIVIEYLKNQGLLRRVKNKTKPTESYKCVHINLSLGEEGRRTIYELQIVFDEYWNLQKKDHDYYELIRVFKD